MDELFEQNRGYLKGVAYRMLGSADDAEDAVQEAWLRVQRAGPEAIDNPRAWLRTIVARVCLDMLRARRSRREDALDPTVPPPSPRRDPEQETVMADAVGIALLVVLDTLAPAERLAFVLHDLFAVPFDEVAAILDRTPEAVRQLASRARRRVRGGADGIDAGTSARRRTVDAFLRALRAGDVRGLVALLDPDLVVKVDARASFAGKDTVVHGAETWASQAVAYARGLEGVRTMLIDGAPGLVLAPKGRLRRVMRFTFGADRIATIEIVGDPVRLRALELSLLDDAEGRTPA
jgi:RNA polymerase sigma factor (sigma-70 family)